MRTALSPWARLRGLTLRSLQDDDLFFPRCRSIHTFGMREPIDIAFVDGGGVVLEVFRDLPPCRIRNCRGAFGACERIAESGPWLDVGDVLLIPGKGEAV